MEISLTPQGQINLDNKFFVVVMISKFNWISTGLGFLLLSGCANAVKSSAEADCKILKGCEQKI